MIKMPINASTSHKNRGMDFEARINDTNEAYKNSNICYISKKATPIKVVETNSEDKIITKAFFSSNSTTDYCGVYKGRYIDFEAKSTNSKTSFPLTNIEDHQLEHMKIVIQNSGISFFLIEFRKLDKIYFIETEKIFSFIKEEGRNSIPLQYFEEAGFLVEHTLKYRVHYISILEKILSF